MKLGCSVVSSFPPAADLQLGLSAALREISSESTKFYCQQFLLLAAVISRQISQIRAHRKQKYLEGSTATRLSEKIWLFAISVKCPFNPTLECGLRDKL